MAKKAKIAAAPKDAPGVCECGCGEPVKPGRSFRQGHDARHKGNLKRAYLAGENRRGITAELKRRGWFKLVNLEVK